jgi:hypothetical protein
MVPQLDASRLAWVAGWLDRESPMIVEAAARISQLLPQHDGKMIPGYRRYQKLTSVSPGILRCFAQSYTIAWNPETENYHYERSSTHRPQASAAT